MLRTYPKFAVVLFVAAAIAFVNSSSAHASSLVDALVSQLGVTNEQATGGAGAIFGLAKQKLTPDEFSQIADAVPDMDSMLSAAPTASAEGTAGEATGGGADVSKMATAAGGSGESTGGAGSMTGMASKATAGALGMTGNLGSLAPSFEQLGMSPDKVQEFIPVILEYVNSEGGSTAMGLLKGALL